MIRYASKQISLATRNRPIKKTVTKKSFAGVSVNQRDKNGLNVLAKAAESVINKQLVNAASDRNISARSGIWVLRLFINVSTFQKAPTINMPEKQLTGKQLFVILSS